MRHAVWSIAVMFALMACAGDEPEPSTQWRRAFRELQAETHAQGGYAALLTPGDGASIHVTDAVSLLRGMSFYADGTSNNYGVKGFAALIVKPSILQSPLPPSLENLVFAGEKVQVQVLLVPSRAPVENYRVLIHLPVAVTEDDDPVLWSAVNLDTAWLNLFEQGQRWSETHVTTHPELRTVELEGNVGTYAAVVKDRESVCADEYFINCFPRTMAATFTTPTDVPLLGYPVPATDEDDKLLAAALRRPEHGELLLLSAGTFSYTPDSGFQGADHFTFFVTDGHSSPVTGTVRIIVE